MVSLLKRYILVIRILTITTKEIKFILNNNNYTMLFDVLLEHHMFFLCISFSELYIGICSTNTEIAYASLAYSYQKTDFLLVSEYYYTKARNLVPSYTESLFRLAKLN